MSTTTNHLVTELRIAAWDQMRAAPYSNWEYSELPEKAKARVDRAVAAVLRTLAESGQVAWADSLAGLADTVDGGDHP